MSSRPVASPYRFREDVDPGWYRVLKGAEFVGYIYRAAPDRWLAPHPGSSDSEHRTRLDAAHSFDT